MATMKLRYRQLGNDSQLNRTCHEFHTEGCFNWDAVDPDIAGIGVIAATIFSTVLTILCLLVAWFKNLIRGFPEHPADIHVRSIFHWFSRLQNKTAISDKSHSAFDAIVLAFSDQQLVTGLTLLVSIYIKSDITVYTFSTATAVAWFSSTTHLATLVVLRRYLNEHKLVRYCRIAFMIPNAALLLASQIRCNGLSGNQPWTYMHCVTYHRTDVDIISISFVAVWLVFAFTNRIIEVCYYKHSPSYRTWIFEVVAHRLRLEPKDENTGWPTNLQLLNVNVNHAAKFSTLPRDTLLSMAVVTYFMMDVMDSLFWEILWLCFSFLYGITGVVLAMITCSQSNKDQGTCWNSMSQMSLGQIMPLLLLLLPVFSFLESLDQPKVVNRTEDETHTTTLKPDDTSISIVEDDHEPDRSIEPPEALLRKVFADRDVLERSRRERTLEPRDDPYHTHTGIWVASVLYVYLFVLFVAAGVLANGILDNNAIELVVVVALVYATYFVRFLTDYRILALGFHN